MCQPSHNAAAHIAHRLFAGLNSEAIRVGRHHVAATVTTLVLAYAGGVLAPAAALRPGDTPTTGIITGELPPLVTVLRGDISRVGPRPALPAEVDLDDLRKELVDAGLDAGPLTIAWHLHQRHDLTVSAATIRRRLLDAGFITPNPKKRPRRSYIGFEAEVPNECWPSDFFHWRLADGTDTEILTWLDDHARDALTITLQRRVTGNAVIASSRAAVAQHGYPASVLADNGLVYTTRFAGGRGGPNDLETLLVELGIEQNHSRPHHPTTCGKVERFQHTTQRWLAARDPAATIADLQAQLDKTGVISRPRAGRRHHIGTGRAHTAKTVLALIDDPDIRVIATTTGQLPRHLTLNPTRHNQPPR